MPHATATARDAAGNAVELPVALHNDSVQPMKLMVWWWV